MKPSVLFVTTVPITLEMFLAPFALHFRAQGWRVDALANGAATAERIADAFDSRYDAGWSRNPLSPANLTGTAGRVRNLVVRNGYEIVHVHTPVAAFATRFALRRLPPEQRPIVVYTAHGFHFYRGQRAIPHAIFRTLERLAAPWTDYLVTINAEDYEAACGLGGIAPERVRLISGIGVDVARFAGTSVSNDAVTALRGELSLPDGAFVLTIVAEFGAVKRHEDLFRALVHVRDPRVVLVLAGDGPLEQRLREHAAALGIADRVRWAGYRRDVPVLLAASDAVVLVSEREGLARSLLEGMAAGRPVIGTDTRGIADAVGGDAGWIVPKHDVHALAAAIDEAAADPAEATRRGAVARARAEAEFALPRIVAEYEELYREALASRV